MKSFCIFLIAAIFFMHSGTCLAASKGMLLEAEILFLKGKYTEAKRDLKPLLDTTGRSQRPKVLFLYSVCLMKTSKYAQARKHLSELMSEYSQSSWCDDAVLAVGDSFYMQGNFEKALGTYRSLCEQYPNSELKAIALYKSGKCSLKAGSWEQARFYLQKVQRDYPLSFEAKDAAKFLKEDDFYFTVQVGSFRNYSNAKALAARLKARGFDSYIRKIEEDSQRYYRVRVGRFSNITQAKALKRKLSKEDLPATIYP